MKPGEMRAVTLGGGLTTWTLDNEVDGYLWYRDTFVLLERVFSPFDDDPSPANTLWYVMSHVGRVIVYENDIASRSECVKKDEKKRPKKA